MGTPNLTVVISTAAVRPYLPPISRQIRRIIPELWCADLTYSEGDGGLGRRDVLASTHGYARLSLAGRKNLFSDPWDLLIVTPGDLKSAPPSELHLVPGPDIQSEMLRELWNTSRASSQWSDRSKSIRPLTSTRPVLDASSMAAELLGNSADESNLGEHHRREVRRLSLGDALASLGGPSKRMKKLIDAARAPAGIREFLDSGRKLKLLRQTDLSFQRISSGLRCWGLFCDLNMLPHFPPTELAVLRWSSFFSAGRTFRMYLAHPAKGFQLNNCDATSRYTGRVKAAAGGLCNLKNCPFAARPAASRGQLRQLRDAFRRNFGGENTWRRGVYSDAHVVASGTTLGATIFTYQSFSVQPARFGLSFVGECW